jgi:hypothetical protein
VAATLMRAILAIAFLLFGVGLVSCRIEGRAPGNAPAIAIGDWVRTVDGWERSHDWAPSLAAPPAVHPLVIAATQLLISVFALTAWSMPATPVLAGR